MEVVSIVLIVFISVIVLPIVAFICTDSKDRGDSEPRPLSIKKKSSKEDVSKKKPSRSSGLSQRKSKSSDKEEVTVLTNGTAVAAYEEIAGPSDNTVENGEGGNTYEEPEALVVNPQQVNMVLTNGGATSPVLSTVNETSPPNSQRSSAISTGQTRVVSLDRALPEIPALPSARHSLASERSPSTKRALPELPGEDGANVYDQLERDLPPHQIRSKSSESSSVKAKTHTAVEEMGAAESSESLIEPDEVTRSSVFVSANSADPYSILDDAPINTPSSHQTSVPHEITKPKTKVQYSKVKKDSTAEKGANSPVSPHLMIVDNEEPVYTEPPPVPDKMYNLAAEMEDPAGGGEVAATAGAGGGVALVIDNNGQDSGSGYYAVTDDGHNNVMSTHDDLPENYNILTARESIAVVRARQNARYEADEDYYESMDDKPAEGAQGGLQLEVNNNAAELYAEIDNETSASAVISSNTPGGMPTKQNVGNKEELYAEIDSPNVSSTKVNNIGNNARVNTLLPPSNIDPGYEKVDFGEPKGEQMDSAGYAIVKDSNRPAAAGSTVQIDDEEDYAECDPSPSAIAATLHAPSGAAAALVSSSSNLSRNDSDLSGYATVSYDNPAQPSSNSQLPSASQVSNNNSSTQARPFQRYQRREHVYQDIDEVRNEKTPPDKS